MFTGHRSKYIRERVHAASVSMLIYEHNLGIMGRNESKIL